MLGNILWAKGAVSKLVAESTAEVDATLDVQGQDI